MLHAEEVAVEEEVDARVQSDVLGVQPEDGRMFLLVVGVNRAYQVVVAPVADKISQDIQRGHTRRQGASYEAEEAFQGSHADVLVGRLGYFIHQPFAVRRIADFVANTFFQQLQGTA